jgi:hypothetical protein
MVLLIALVIGLAIWLRRRNQNRRAEVTVDRSAQARGIAALRSRDPGFDPQAFAERTKATMSRVNEAWIAGSMSPARRLISDGVFVRFQTQLRLLRADGLRNLMADWRVVSADLLAAEADDRWDTVHVKVVGEARDADVRLDLPPDQAEKKVRAAPLSPYHEVWSFIRRRGQTTPTGSPALEGRCPSCGADLPVADTVRCDYCEALVNSGEHDWVLAEITQPEEWSAEVAEEEIGGLAEIRQRDASVSRQELEDRASVIFWKWIEARRTGKPDSLARFCVVKPDGSTAAQLGLVPAALRQVAVGSSEVVEVVPGGPSGRDRVVVEIRWSASVDGHEPVGRVDVFAIERSTEAQSKNGLSSLDCPVCRGALAESDAPTCSFCGEALSGGKHEWALASVTEGEWNR